MCVTDRHDMTLAVKVALNPNTTNQLRRGKVHFHKLNSCCTIETDQYQTLIQSSIIGLNSIKEQVRLCVGVNA